MPCSDLLSELENFKSVYNFDSERKTIDAFSLDITFKEKILYLYNRIRGIKLNGCPNCLFDAYIYLRTLKPENIMNNTGKYRLRAGVVLTDIVNQDPRKMCSNANMTEELALYHLRTNYKHAFARFEKSSLPENLDELLNGQSEVKITETDVDNKTDLPKIKLNGIAVFDDETCIPISPEFNQDVNSYDVSLASKKIIPLIEVDREENSFISFIGEKQIGKSLTICVEKNGFEKNEYILNFVSKAK